jgi:hypothetical protein
VWAGPGQVVKDANLRVQEAIHLIFATFRETWSIRQTFKWFRDHEIEVPVTQPRGGRMVVAFQRPRLSFIGDVLHNPFYAGAYTWGRHPVEVVWRDGNLRKRRTPPCPRAQQRLPPGPPTGIDWPTEEHQRMIQRTITSVASRTTQRAPPGGSGTADGVLRCRRCGRKLHARV